MFSSNWWSTRSSSSTCIHSFNSDKYKQILFVHAKIRAFVGEKSLSDAFEAANELSAGVFHVRFKQSFQ